MPAAKLSRHLLLLLSVLGLAACTGDGRNEPLYALVDRTQRVVAVAGQSQLGGAPAGSEVQVVVGGREQTLMVAERVGTGPILRATPAPAPEMALASAELTPLPVTTAALPPPERTGSAQQARRAGQRGAVASEPGMNARTGRRAGPTSRAVSRSVM